MSTVDKLLAKKNQEIWSVSPDDTVFDAVKLMNEKGIGALAVILDDSLIGIISERDCARKIILEELSPKTTKIKEIMIRRIFHTEPEQKVDECMLVMTKNHIRHLPVLNHGKIVGMISLGDVVENIIEEQQDQIKHLEHYLIWEESY